QPWAEGLSVAQGPELLERDRERVLHYVFGVAPRSEQTQRDASHELDVPPIDGFLRPPVALLGAVDELPIRRVLPPSQRLHLGPFGRSFQRGEQAWGSYGPHESAGFPHGPIRQGWGQGCESWRVQIGSNGGPAPLPRRFCLDPSWKQSLPCGRRGCA